jgi:RNA polymerase sigma factor (sigma-70 family)
MPRQRPVDGPLDAERRATAQLVRSAASGDRSAWDSIVERYSGLVWSVARGHRLGPADAADVTQTVWLRLVENLDRLRDPEHVGGWLATTTRHECLRVLRRNGREVPGDDVQVDAPTAVEDSPEWHTLSSESRRLVWLALSHLSERCKLLLRALAYSPDSSYAEISDALGMPVGSIGPTRARCLERLRRRLVDTGYLPGSNV